MSPQQRMLALALAASLALHCAAFAALWRPVGEPGGGSPGAGGDASGDSLPGGEAAGPGDGWTVSLVDLTRLPSLAPSPKEPVAPSPAASSSFSLPTDAPAAGSSEAAPRKAVPAPTAAPTPAPIVIASEPSATPAEPARRPAAVDPKSDASAEPSFESTPTRPPAAERRLAAASMPPRPQAATRPAGAIDDATGAHGTTGPGAPGAAPGVGPPGGWPGPGDVDRAARPRRPIRPHYPNHARRRGEESTVLIQAWVDESGDVSFASVLESGGDDFDDSARVAVHDSRFEPARLGGESVASRVALRIHFELRD